MDDLRIRRLELPAAWVDFNLLAHFLRENGELHTAGLERIYIRVPRGCNIMVDAGTQLLSLLNQLARTGKRITVEFADGAEGVMSYLSRLGFFDWLAPSIDILPSRPAVSRARQFAGRSENVLEFIPICPASRNRTIPKRLADRLEQACSGRPDCTRLGLAAYTLFAEMIDNIYEHSETEIDGYAALQVYPRTRKVFVAVSDSGHGIVDTIRPYLAGTPVASAPDPEVIVYMFNHGLSRFGRERGCGLRQCAEHALKYSAELFIRLPHSSFHLVPGERSYRQQHMAFSETNLPLVRGTHVAFNFQLDTQAKNLV